MAQLNDNSHPIRHMRISLHIQWLVMVVIGCSKKVKSTNSSKLKLVEGRGWTWDCYLSHSHQGSPSVSRAPLSLCFYYRINYTISLFFRNIISSLCISHSRAPADAPMPKAFLFAFLECVKKKKNTSEENERMASDDGIKDGSGCLKQIAHLWKKSFESSNVRARSSKICDRYTRS